MYQNSIIITGIKNENKIPSGFSLHQNYPNPFNPSTTISYNLINTGHVRLSIFDVLGKEVSVLVNEKQSSGSYEVRWNASALPSGVYFYRLESGSFSDVKKMILVK
jgi:hypothetical protein